MIAFKGPIDPDYQNYINILENAPNFFDGMPAFKNYTSEVGMEYGFLFINVAFKSFGLEVNWLYSLFGFVSVFFLYKICNYFQSSKYLVFIYLYCLTFIAIFVQIRYGLAMLMSLYAVICIFNKRRLMGGSLFLAALFFHSVVLFWAIPFIAYTLIRNTSSKINFYIMSIIFVIFWATSHKYSSFFYDAATFVNQRYQAYVGEESVRSNVFYRYIIISMLYLFSNKYIYKNTLTVFLLYTSLVSLVVWIAAEYLPVMYRIAVMFEMSLIIFLAKEAYNSVKYQMVARIAIITLAANRLFTAVQDLEPYQFL